MSYRKEKMKLKNFKYRNMNYLGLIMAILLAFACDKDDPGDDTGATYLELTIEGNNQRQLIHGFGASDAWSCQFIGKNWPNSKKKQLAEWLFSTEKQNNSPKGIGLNIWRFNIGGGSAEQGAASGINDEWRRAESFMNGDGTYDWSKHEGQRWFLKEAKQLGVNTFIGFVNSPPVAITENGKAFSSNGNRLNLPKENYNTYSNYLADISTKLQELDGVVLNYISPVNEPQWDWTNSGQEGSPAQNSEIADLVKELDKVFVEKSISSKIEIPESGQLNYLYENDNKPGRGEQINAFFDSHSENYVGNLESVAKKIAGHSYYTTWPLNKMEQTRINVKNELNSISDNIEFWMTEYCPLEDNEEINGNGRDLGMNTALYVARVIFSDLALANANTWQWWLAISPYDYKDGLVYTDYNKNDGKIFDSKTLWALGNYSRFIKPGMRRVSVARSDGRTDGQTLDGLMCSSYVSDDKSKNTTVIVNYGQSTIPVKLTLENVSPDSELKLYVTDGKSENDLAYKGTFSNEEAYDVPPRSIITFTNVE